MLKTSVFSIQTIIPFFIYFVKRDTINNLHKTYTIIKSKIITANLNTPKTKAARSGGAVQLEDVELNLTLYTAHSYTLDDELGKNDINKHNGDNGEKNKHINLAEVAVSGVHFASQE